MSNPTRRFEMENPVEMEKRFTSALINTLALQAVAPSKDEVAKKAAILAEFSGYNGNLAPVIEEAMIAIDTRMGAGVSLIDLDAKHDEEWVRKRHIEWIYSNAYENFLRDESWPPEVVQSLSDVATRILGHLQDPTDEGAWDRRGLVIGHVQSGKTANYLGLIAKAADAKYKFIIVIAGIHNNLRRQTQERIDQGFVGRSSDPNNRVPIGVGLKGNYPHPVTLTNVLDDFSKKTADQGGWRLNDFSKPIIFVIKKNVKTLESLHNWLKQMNTQGKGRKISNVPLLMIDDEADNASINTNKEDIDPTKTNALIRRILNLFEKSCYVGYTATPFANIFINPESYHDDELKELFPKDFIYCLDAPNTYFGPDKVFIDERSSEQILVPINDCEDYLPLSHKIDHSLKELPPSLYRAIDQFVISRAIRNVRGHTNKHCSMMVNISRFVRVQKKVRDFISVYVNKMSNAVKANYAMSDSIADQNSFIRSLRNVFEEDFNNCGHEWKDIKNKLHSVFENIRLFVVNSSSDEILDYRKYERDGHGLTAIAIGGLSLSRGLTIEGLSISYMYRNTRMYDTLMQMGRWFGYRPGYEDLCRVHLSRDSIDWYSHISEASEELRQQIKRMRRDNLSPKQFGLYVKAHPDQLLITAANKMRSGQQITVQQNLSGKIIESYILPTKEKINRENEELIAKFWSNNAIGMLENTDKGWIIRNVSVEVIDDFLRKFQVHSSFIERKQAALDYLQAIAKKYAYGDVLLISIAGKGQDGEGIRLGSQQRKCNTLGEDFWHISKNRVASKGDEKLGLTKAQLDEAINIANSKQVGKAPSDVHYRDVRDKPLLMIHVLEPDPKQFNYRFPAFGISFPGGDYVTEIKVVANIRWLEQMCSGGFDSPDEEEDYD